MPKKGFSLLEVMISLVILSFLMIGVYTMVDTAQRNQEIIVSEDNEILQVQLALNRLGADFSQIYNPMNISSHFKPTRPENPRFPRTTKKAHIVPIIENPEKNTISFMTSANRRKIQDVKQANWLWVQYSLQRQENKDREEGPQQDNKKNADFVFVRKSLADDPFAKEKVDWDDMKEQILLKNVVSLVFEFWDKKREAWTELLSELPTLARFRLKGLKVTLEWIDKTGTTQTNVRVFRPLWMPFERRSAIHSFNPGDLWNPTGSGPEQGAR